VESAMSASHQSSTRHTQDACRLCTGTRPRVTTETGGRFPGKLSILGSRNLQDAAGSAASASSNPFLIWKRVHAFSHGGSVQVCARAGQTPTPVKYRSDTCQTLIEYRSNADRILVKY
jgi:hypothetical protein